jgi:hypothetical protein
MVPDDPQFLFRRPLGRTPWATAFAYAIGVLHFTATVATGLWNDTRESIANGFLDGVYWLGAWVALGTIIALLAQIADRGRREALIVERSMQVIDGSPVERFSGSGRPAA